MKSNWRFSRLQSGRGLRTGVFTLFFIRIILNFGKNFFRHTWTTFPREVFYTLNFSIYFLSAKLEKHELRRATICYWTSIKIDYLKRSKDLGSAWIVFFICRNGEPAERSASRQKRGWCDWSGERDNELIYNATISLSFFSQ